MGRRPASRQYFLVKCFYQNKPLFFLILLFFCLTVYCHKTNCEITPFFIFGMYTGKSEVRKDSFLLIRVNNEKTLNLYHTIDEPRRMMIFSTLTAYYRGVSGGYKDPFEAPISAIGRKHPFMRSLAGTAYCRKEDYLAYPSWFLSYLRSAVGKDIRTIDISMSYIHFDDHNLPVSDSLRHLYQFD
jgi:hypothetical protein